MERLKLIQWRLDNKEKRYYASGSDVRYLMKKINEMISLMDDHNCGYVECSICDFLKGLKEDMYE